MLQAAEHWEKALAVNPLNPDGWFSLGHCMMKCAPPASEPAAEPGSARPEDPAEEPEAEAAAVDSKPAAEQGPSQRALQAFTRTVQQAPDNAQAWNNLAALHMAVRHPVPRTLLLLAGM